MAGNASYGKVIDKAEHFAVTQGRELLRSSSEGVVQERINDVGQDEKKVLLALISELNSSPFQNHEQVNPPST